MSNHIYIKNIYEDLEQRAHSLRLDQSLIQKTRQIVEQALDDGKAHYGVNTGFGVLASERIDRDKLRDLQHKLVVSHAAGLGALIPKEITRLMLLLKIHEFGLGYSGVSLEVFNRLLLFLEKDLIPAVPSKGSLGASGDLAPLAHLALPLIGEGFFWSNDGSTIPAADRLKENQLEPITLQAKDGLALCNGTQMMLAYGVAVLYKTQSLIKQADIIASMSLEAVLGSAAPFDERIHQARPHPGQIAVASNIRKLLEESETLASHKDCDRVQDPYSIRCIPQVHGASRAAFNHVSSVLEIEINSATDNPLIFHNGDIVSGGNFHGQPLAITLDYACIALAELGSISERRTYLMTKGNDGLPKMLIDNPGINSGFMVPHYTAAALVSENKVLCHPASVDSIPTCLGQEDHVSMGSIAATKLYEVYDNVEKILAIEMLAAAQGLDFRQPLNPGRGVKLAYDLIRSKTPHLKNDQFYNTEILKGIEILQNKLLLDVVESGLGELH